MKKIATTDELHRYFKIDTKQECVYFTGNKLDIYIPVRYEDKDLVKVTDKVNTLGIFDITIDDEYDIGFLLAAMVDIEYSSIERLTIDDEPYIHMVLNKNDRFLTNTSYIKNDNLGYTLWVEFIALGRLPRFITYEKILWLFDRIAEVTGINFGINHSVFEMLYAHLFRDSKNLAVKYRLTDMSKPPVMIELRNVAYGPDDTMSKILGSYMPTGINAALITESTQPSPVEIQLRS